MNYGQALKPRDRALAFNRHGAQAMERGMYRAATYHLLSAIVEDPELWPAFFNLGTCWYKLDDLEGATWAYEQAVRYCDHHAPLFHNLGTVYCHLGQYRKALPYLQHAWRLREQENDALALSHAYYAVSEEEDFDFPPDYDDGASYL